MNNNRLISRQEAAEKLRCEQQTISNWVEWGIIRGHIIGRRLMVDADTIDAVLDSAHDAARAKKRIEILRQELLDTERELENQVREAKNALRLWKHSDCKRINREAVYAILTAYKPLLTEMENGIIRSLMETGEIPALAETYHLTPQRIVQIIARAIQKINGARRYDSLIEEVATLKRLTHELMEKLESCGEKPDEIENNEAVMKKELKNTTLSVRALNCLKTNDIMNVADLVSFQVTDLLRMRNFGRKSMRELEDLVDSLGLQFGMDVPMYLHSDDYKYTYAKGGKQ